MFKFSIIKKINQTINTIKSQKNLLNSLNPGELVWAKMPLPKKELNKIEESHRIRPYLIMHKDKLNIYAYQSSSKQWDKLNNTQEYCIHKERYKQNKDSYINLTKIYKIPFTNLKRRNITLNDLDLKNIQKRLLIQGEKSKYKFEIGIHILEGDVIRINNQLYYVYASDNIYLYCLSVFRKCPKENKRYTTITINNKRYYSTLKENVSFERKIKLNIINIAYKSEMKEILKKKKDMEFKQKELSNAQKKTIEKTQETVYENGTVFQIGRDKIVYLFKYNDIHYGVDLLMYKIKPRTIKIHNIEEKPILEIMALEEYIKIIEFLSLKNVQPLKEINRLYDELRDVIYS